MSMYTYAVGVVPVNDRWIQMREVYEACREADIDRPEEVDDFFGDADPLDEGGRVIEIEKCTVDYSEEDGQGMEINLRMLNEHYPDVKFVRVINSC